MLKEMPKASLFNVILFSTRVRPWRDAEVPADPRNVQAAIAWAERNLKDPEGDTYVYDALEEAMRIIAKDKKAAAAVYIKLSGSKEDPALIEEILNDPELEFTTTPRRVMDFANFLYETGGLKNKPASWKELYWETVHNLPGS